MVNKTNSIGKSPDITSFFWISLYLWFFFLLAFLLCLGGLLIALSLYIFSDNLFLIISIIFKTVVFSVIGIFNSKKLLISYPKYIIFISNFPEGIGSDKNIYESKFTAILLH